MYSFYLGICNLFFSSVIIDYIISYGSVYATLLYSEHTDFTSFRNKGIQFFRHIFQIVFHSLLSCAFLSYSSEFLLACIRPVIHIPVRTDTTALNRNMAPVEYCMRSPPFLYATAASPHRHPPEFQQKRASSQRRSERYGFQISRGEGLWMRAALYLFVR